MRRVHPERLAEFERMRRRLTWALLSLALLTIIGIVGFLWIGGGAHGVVDAVYMTVITLTTVGYREIIDMTGHELGRIFTMVLLLGGMGIVAYALPLLAAFLIEGHFLNAFARRRMQKVIEAMSGHHIVCGCTPAAAHVAAELTKTGRQVVLVAPAAEDIDEIRERAGDLVGLVGDPSDDDVLKSAGIERAGGLVACSSSDKDNVIVSLTARRLAPDLRIISSTELPENAAKMKAAGADSVVSPCMIGGLRMASELVRPHVVSFLDMMLRDQKQASLRVEQVIVPEGAATSGRTVGELNVDEVAGALLLASAARSAASNSNRPPICRSKRAWPSS